VSRQSLFDPMIYRRVSFFKVFPRLLTAGGRRP
jgi:hypothetical protein